MIYGPFDAMKFEILEMLKDEDTCRAEVEEELSTIPQGRKLGQIMAPLIGAGSYIVDAGTGVTALGDEDVSAPSNNGDSFDAPAKWLGRLGYNSGWRVDKHPRFLSDVNGDGLPDVVGFGDAGVFVALNNGDSFDTETEWLGGLGYNSGWRVDKHPRFLSDVNGDGLPDVVGFGNEGIFVALKS